MLLQHYEAVKKYISQGPKFIDVHMHRPQATSRNFMDALLAFWPGLQVRQYLISILVHSCLFSTFCDTAILVLYNNDTNCPHYMCLPPRSLYSGIQSH